MGTPASSDGLGGALPAAPPAGHCADSVRCSRGAEAPGSLLTGGLAHSCTRRDLLGAAVAGPLAAGQARTLPSLAQQVSSPLKGSRRWENALARLPAAEAAMRSAEGRTGADWEAQWALDEAFSDAVVGFNDALQRLLLVPAPDLSALAVKIGRAIDEQAWELPRGNACMARVKGDLARLIP